MAGTNKIAPTFLVVLSFAAIYIVWGSTYFFILKSLEGFPPMMLGALRFIIAGSLMIIWSLLKGDKMFITKNVMHSVVSGILMLFGGTGVVIWVEQYLPSAFVAILVSAAPFWFVLLDKPKWKENFTSKSIISGLIIGFIGIVLLFGEKINSIFFLNGNHAELGAMLLILGGSLCWTAGSLYSKYKSTSGSNTVNVGWQMLAAGIPFILLSFLRGEHENFHWQSVPLIAWLSMAYLIFFGSIAAYTAYVWLLQVRSAAQVSTYAYVNPVVAVLLGILFASEKISFLQVLGLVIILGSVLLINLAKNKSDKKIEHF